MNCIIWLIPMLLKMYFKCKSTANLRIFLKPLLNDSSIYFLFNINFFIFDIYFLFWSRYLIVMCFNSTLNLKCVVMNTPYETVNNVLLKAVKRQNILFKNDGRVLSYYIFTFVFYICHLFVSVVLFIKWRVLEMNLSCPMLMS